MTIKLGTLITGLATVALLAAGWFFLAPAQLGGGTSYVQVYGTSMQPRFHAGDFVVVRAAGSYHVGEIVAYRNAELGDHVVLHRITGVANGRYTFKGDNNDFVDSYHPTRSELVGRMWLHVPAAGRYLVWLRGNRLFFLLGGVAAFLTLLAAGLGGKRVRAGVRPGGSAPFGALPLAAAALALGFVVLAALSYTRPLTAPAVRQGLYTQTGRFAYEASVPGGEAVYGSSTVTTGQPLFLRLVHSASFRFSYAFGSTAAHRISGRIGLDAVVTGSNGWKRTLHLAAPRPFSGDHAVTGGVLGFRPLMSLLKRVDALSNVNGGTYTLTLLPTVQLQGVVGATALHQTFTPKLDLLLDPNQLQLQPGGATGPSAALALTQTTSGAGTVGAPSEISLLKLKLRVRLAREIALYGGAATLILLLAGLLVARHARPAGEHDGIRREYGELIVDVAALPTERANRVETRSFDGIARIAEQSGRMIMHVEHPGLHTYFVEDGGVLYTFRHGEGGDEPAAAPLRLAEGA